MHSGQGSNQQRRCRPLPRNRRGAVGVFRTGTTTYDPAAVTVCPIWGPALGACEHSGGTLLSSRELQNGKTPQQSAPDASAVGTVTEEERGRKLRHSLVHVSSTSSACPFSPRHRSGHKPSLGSSSVRIIPPCLCIFVYTSIMSPEDTEML